MVNALDQVKAHLVVIQGLQIPFVKIKVHLHLFDLGYIRVVWLLRSLHLDVWRHLWVHAVVEELMGQGPLATEALRAGKSAIDLRLIGHSAL